jgi:carbon storage regulator
MLVLTRKPGEKVMIGGGIELTVVAVQGDRVRLGVAAPPTVAVDRWEVWQRREAPARRNVSRSADAK